MPKKRHTSKWVVTRWLMASKQIYCCYKLIGVSWVPMIMRHKKNHSNTLVLLYNNDCIVLTCSLWVASHLVELHTWSESRLKKKKEKMGYNPLTIRTYGLAVKTMVDKVVNSHGIYEIFLQIKLWSVVVVIVTENGILNIVRTYWFYLLVNKASPHREFVGKLCVTMCACIHCM